MYTRCPHCQTLYRVREEELAAADGLARCCRCEKVFNALQHLQENIAAAPATPSPEEQDIAAAFASEPTDEEPPPPAEEEIEFSPPSYFVYTEDDTVLPEEAEAEEEDEEALPSIAAPPPKHTTPFPEDFETEVAIVTGEAYASSLLPPEVQKDEQEESSVAAMPPPEDQTLEEASAIDEDTLLSFTTDLLPAEEQAPPEEPDHLDEEGEDVFSAAAEEEPEFRFEFELEAEAEEAQEPSPEVPAEQAESPLPFEVPENLPDIQPSEAPDPFAVAVASTKKRSPGKTMLWGLGSVLLLALLAGQLAWYQRERLMQHPTGLMILKMGCELADCRLPQRRAPDQIEVLSREIKTHPHAPQALLLRLVMANRANFAQPYPVIELSLFSSDEQLVARRNFRPREYLAPEQDSSDLLPPGQSLQIEMTLEDPGKEVTGFRFDFL